MMNFTETLMDVSGERVNLRREAAVENDVVYFVAPFL